MQKKVDSARLIIEIIAIIIGGIIAIVIGVKTYNSRFDANAKVAGGFQVSFVKNCSNHEAACTFTSSAGKLSYGVVQYSGAKDTMYKLYYKKVNNASFVFAKNLTMKKNGLDGKQGAFQLTTLYHSQAFDFKVRKTSNWDTASKLEVDWGVS